MNLWDKFVEFALCDFRFLETEFGFKCTSIKQPFIIYESEKLEVDVFYDVGRNRELDLGIRRRGDNPQRPLSISPGMLMRLKEGESSEGYMSPYPSTEESLKREVSRLAQLLRKYGRDLLAGDLTDFKRVEQKEKELAKKYGRKNS